jgi:flagellar basal body-associated protein FliL
MNAPKFTKNLLLIASVLGSFAAWAKTSTDMKNVLLVITEPARVSSKKERLYQVVRIESGKATRYEFSLSQNSKEIRTSAISEQQYNHLRDKLFRLLVKKDARAVQSPAMEKCQASLKIQLQQIKENGLICVGDYRNYFQAKAILAEIK